MESLSYAFEGKGLFLPDDTDSPIDSLVTNRTLLDKWDRIESMEFISNQFSKNSVDETNDNNVSNSTITLNSSVEFGTRFSVLANDKDSVFPQESNSKRSAKRARVTHLQSQIPSCQVYGCNKDLSDAKDYHKRHKVCNVHSKASLVVVNGIQQRFCQQCSRFHILAEFDEGKRSCRKRLAGHNERRRKPQFNAHFGSTVFTTDLSPNGSLFFSRILPNSYFPPQVNEPTNNITNIKFEPEPSQISQSSMNIFENRQCPKTCLKTPLSFQDSSFGSNSSCALSLLSAKYYNSLPDSTGLSITPTNQNFSTNFINPNIDFIPEARFSENGISQDLNGLNAKGYISPESAKTVDLVELSLHLQRVEQQKYNAQVKLENGNVRDSTTT